MRKIYLSFLGLGSKQKNGSSGYYPSVYMLDARKSAETQFVQAAELELLGPEIFERIFIIDTLKSHAANFAMLEEELRRLGAANIHAVTIDEEMSAQGQWRWFESILSCIEPADKLTVDLTHGYRAAPIILSAALNFLQKARNVRLDAVYYGVFEKAKELGYAPIIDMKDFYVINEWADAVGRLVEDADARKMAWVAEIAPDFQFNELNDPEVVQGLEQLTAAVRNIDVNHVAEVAGRALELVKLKERSASQAGKMLLRLVIDKFVSLTIHSTGTGKYDVDYFGIQIQLIKLLLEHRLFMQAYTVMRELIASLGMFGFEREGMNNEKRKKRRKTHAEIFIRMLQNDEAKWSFTRQEQILERMRPFYEELKSYGIEKELRAVVKDLTDYRNGFDHAWTCKPMASDIETKGFQFLEQLEKILEGFRDKRLLSLN